jgi:hypothetical protein
MTPKRPMDPNQLAKSIIDIATGQVKVDRATAAVAARSLLLDGPKTLTPDCLQFYRGTLPL